MGYGFRTDDQNLWGTDSVRICSTRRLIRLSVRLSFGVSKCQLRFEFYSILLFHVLNVRANVCLLIFRLSLVQFGFAHFLEVCPIEMHQKYVCHYFAHFVFFILLVSVFRLFRSSFAWFDYVLLIITIVVSVWLFFIVLLASVDSRSNSYVFRYLFDSHGSRYSF